MSHKRANGDDSGPPAAQVKLGQSKRRASWRAKAGLAAAALVVAFALSELALRLVGIGHPLFYVPDPHCASRHRPGFAAWQTKEGRAYVSINSDGFRDREHMRAKPAGTWRIAVLGDSFAEALQVDRQRTFWAEMERRLAGCQALAGRHVEVLNYGVSGYGTAQELQMLRHYVWQYDPDVVLLVFYAGNDVQNNSSRLESDPVKPFFHLENERLVLDDSFLRQPLYRRANSTSEQWKNAVVNRLRLWQLIREIRARRSRQPDHSPAETGLNPHVYSHTDDALWNEAWDLTRRLMVNMNDEVRSRGAEFWVVTVSHPLQVWPEAALRERLQRELSVPDLFHPDRTIRRLGDVHGFPVINLAEPMQKFAERHRVYLHGFPNLQMGMGHWNETGHELAAALISAAMCRHWQTNGIGNRRGAGNALAGW